MVVLAVGAEGMADVVKQGSNVKDVGKLGIDGFVAGDLFKNLHGKACNMGGVLRLWIMVV